MKLNKEGFGAVEALLAIIAVTLIVGLGYYVVNTNKDKNAKTTNSNTASVPTANSQQAAQPQKTDKELIIEAVKADMPGITDSNITIQEIVGDNAKGNVFVQDQGGGVFITHKTDGKWSVVFKGQQAPDPELAARYNFPASWYQ